MIFVIGLRSERERRTSYRKKGSLIKDNEYQPGF